jgi:putative membrane protein
MKTLRAKFLVRWFVCSFGLWVAVALLGTDKISYNGSIAAIAVSGLVLAIVNTFVKPVMVFLTLPAVLLSLGIVMLLINGFMVVLAARLYGPLEVEGLGVAIVVGIVVGLTNWMVSALFEENK